jgi:hypothetical protein
MNPVHFILRTYPGYNLKKALAAFPSKREIISANILSLIKCMRGCDYLTIVVDNPTQEYLQEITRILGNNLNPRYVILPSSPPFGNSSSFKSSLSIALDSDCENIFFCEDDYLFHDKLLDELHHFLLQYQNADFCFPFTHPSYSKLLIHTCYNWLIMRNLRVIKGPAIATPRLSGCLTFWARKSSILLYKDSFELYADAIVGDHNMWKLITIPFLAAISSGIEQRNRFDRYISRTVPIIFKNIFRRKKAKVYSLNKNLGIHLANDCLPVALGCLQSRKISDSFVRSYAELVP